MTNPTELGFQDHGLDAGHLGSVQNLNVCVPVLPVNVHDRLHASHVELLQLLQMSFVHGPRLTSVEEAGENDGPVHLYFRGHWWIYNIVLIQDAGMEPTDSLTGLADPGIDLLIRAVVLADGTAEVLKVVHLQLGILDGNGEGWGG